MKIDLGYGRIKNPDLKDLAADYQKRLGRFVKLRKIKNPEYIIEFCGSGEKITSEGLADIFRELMLHGKSSVRVQLGDGVNKKDSPAADGVTKQKIQLVNQKISPDLQAVMLLEQVYRAFMIIGGRSYHK